MKTLHQQQKSNKHKLQHKASLHIIEINKNPSTK